MSEQPKSSRNPIQFRVSAEEDVLIAEHAAYFGVSRNLAAKIIFQHGLRRDSVSSGMKILVERTVAMEELLKTLISAADRKRYEHAQNKTQERLISLRKSGLI